MDLQMHISAESFSAKAQEISNDLKFLEKKAIEWGASGNGHEQETLNREFREIVPALSSLRLDCLCLSLSKDYQNQSAEMFQTLKRLNRLVDLLQGFTIEKAGSTPSALSKTAENIASLQKAIADTRWQLNRNAHHPTPKQ